MGWREREYSTGHSYRDRFSAGGFSLPPRATLTLIVLHTLAYLAATLVRVHDGRKLGEFLGMSNEHAAAAGIATHPFATVGVLTLAIVVFVAWSVGSRVERAQGPGRLVLLYVVGNLFAGLAFFGVVKLQPELGKLALDYPAGALAAWCVEAWRGVFGEYVSIFGKMRNVGRVTAVVVVALLLLTLLLHGFGAVGWLLAIASGAAAAPAVASLPRMQGAQFRVPRLRMPVRRSRPAHPSRGEVGADSPAEPMRRGSGVEIDDILAKISREGLSSLTEAERARLEAARRAMLQKTL